MEKFSKTLLLLFLFLNCNMISYSQVRKSTKENTSENGEATFEASKNKDPYVRYIENYIYDPTKKINLLKTSDIKNVGRKNYPENTIIGKLKPSKILQNFANIYSFSSDKNKSRFTYNYFEFKKNYSIDEIKSIIFDDLNSSNLDKNTIEMIRIYMENYQQQEKIESTPIYKNIVDNLRTSHYPERVAFHTFIRIYLDKIAEFDINYKHTAFTLYLLSKANLGSDVSDRILFEATCNEKTRIFLINQFHSLVYDYWKENINSNKLLYEENIIASFHLLDKLREDNPDIDILMNWISKNYWRFMSYSDDLLEDSLPNSPDFNNEIGVVAQFAILNILKSKNINEIYLYSGNDNPESTQIDKYKIDLINKIPANNVRISVETQSSNQCLKKYDANFIFNYEPKVLFRGFYNEQPSYKFEKNIVFVDKDNKVSLKEALEEKSNIEDGVLRVTYQYSKSDILLYYLFERNQNTFAKYLNDSFDEVIDSLKVYNQKKLKETLKDNLFFSNFKETDELIKSLVEVSISNYNPDFFDREKNPNNERIINYMLQVQNEAKVSYDSLILSLTDHLNSLISKTVLPKPLDLMKKEVNIYFDNLYNSLVKKKEIQKIDFLGNLEYNYSTNPGFSNMKVYPDKKVVLDFKLYINGEGIYKYLDGKLTKSTNGFYQVVTNEGVFNIQFTVDQCGKKSIDLVGTGRNSNIRGVFYVD